MERDKAFWIAGIVLAFLSLFYWFGMVTSYSLYGQESIGMVQVLASLLVIALLVLFALKKRIGYYGLLVYLAVLAIAATAALISGLVDYSLGIGGATYTGPELTHEQILSGDFFSQPEQWRHYFLDALPGLLLNLAIIAAGIAFTVFSKGVFGVKELFPKKHGGKKLLVGMLLTCAALVFVLILPKAALALAYQGSPVLCFVDDTGVCTTTAAFVSGDYSLCHQIRGENSVACLFWYGLQLEETEACEEILHVDPERADVNSQGLRAMRDFCFSVMARKDESLCESIQLPEIRENCPNEDW